MRTIKCETKIVVDIQLSGDKILMVLDGEPFALTKSDAARIGSALASHAMQLQTATNSAGAADVLEALDTDDDTDNTKDTQGIEGAALRLSNHLRKQDLAGAKFSIGVRNQEIVLYTIRITSELMAAVPDSWEGYPVSARQAFEVDPATADALEALRKK